MRCDAPKGLRPRRPLRAYGRGTCRSLEVKNITGDLAVHLNIRVMGEAITFTRFIEPLPHRDITDGIKPQYDVGDRRFELVVLWDQIQPRGLHAIHCFPAFHGYG